MLSLLAPLSYATGTLGSSSSQCTTIVSCFSWGPMCGLIPEPGCVLLNTQTAQLGTAPLLSAYWIWWQQQEPMAPVAPSLSVLGIQGERREVLQMGTGILCKVNFHLISAQGIWFCIVIPLLLISFQLLIWTVTWRCFHAKSTLNTYYSDKEYFPSLFYTNADDY